MLKTEQIRTAKTETSSEPETNPFFLLQSLLENKERLSSWIVLGKSIPKVQQALTIAELRALTDSMRRRPG
jgi:hypothetical protein